jgi:hypothetical protein
MPRQRVDPPSGIGYGGARLDPCNSTTYKDGIENETAPYPILERFSSESKPIKLTPYQASLVKLKNLFDAFILSSID